MIRKKMIKRMSVEIRVALRHDSSADPMMVACELLDSANRPYGREFAQLGYDDSPRKASKFFADLMRSVNHD